jgi:hypothetical protein
MTACEVILVQVSYFVNRVLKNDANCGIIEKLVTTKTYMWEKAAQWNGGSAA